MRCPYCNEIFHYPQDELVFLDSNDMELFYQDALDYGFNSVICCSCHKEGLHISV